MPVCQQQAGCFFEIAQLTGRGADMELASVIADRHAGRIIAAVFQTAHFIKNNGLGALRADVAGNTAH